MRDRDRPLLLPIDPGRVVLFVLFVLKAVRRLNPKPRTFTPPTGSWNGARHMRRLRSGVTLSLVGFSCFLHAAAVRAESAAQSIAPSAGAEPAAAEPAKSAAVPAAASSLAGFEVLASFGYGASTSKIFGADFQPYSATVGLNFGYTFRSGFRLGGVFGYGLGRSVNQRYEPVVGKPYDLTTDSSILNLATSLGYDVPLSFLVLRYTVNLGVSVMSWDLGDVPPNSVFGNLLATSPNVGVFIAPGVTLLWRRELFECGLGANYLVQSNNAIPTGFLGELLAGVKL